MKRILFSMLAAIGIFVAYQSIKSEAKAQKPVIEIPVVCMDFYERICPIGISEAGTIIFDDINGKPYSSHDN
mgnify:CR=1 FL=1